MKRELGYVLESQSPLTASLGRTRSLTLRSGDDSSRQRKSSADYEPGSTGYVDHSEERTVEMDQCDWLSVCRRKKRFKTATSPGEDLILEELKGHAEGLMAEVKFKEVADDEFAEPLITGGSCVVKNVAEMVVEDSRALENDVQILIDPIVEVKKDMQARIPRRFTRSALKLKPEEVVESDLATSEGHKDLEIQETKGRENVAVSLLATPAKLEMKMSKKIAVTGKPSTLRELLKSGLLEGYPVFYNVGNKSQRTAALRGTIKDAGILCYCSLCHGLNVLSPSQFEIHACNSYRHAAQYICLENGKSLLDVLKACQISSMQTLEETIKSLIGPSVGEEAIICHNCKGPFFATSVMDNRKLCGFCMDSMKLPLSPNAATCVKTRLSEPTMPLKPSGSVSVDILQKCDLRVARKSPRLALIPKSSGSVLLPISSINKSHKKILKKLSSSALGSRVINSASDCFSPQNKSQWKITKKDLRLHKLVFEEGGLPDGAEVTYYARGKNLLVGYKRGSGILCRCCNSELSPSQFEVHAGWASRKKPYQYIYTSNGVSLHELAISLLKGRKHSAKDNDDLCSICADGGNLILCDICPRAFHKDCASLSSIPRGKWYCKYCENMFQREKFVEHNANAVAAGRIIGIDSIEQISSRCIRIVKIPKEAEVIACVLCRGYDFSKSGFGPRTVILCDQCEKEYHVGCLKKHKMADLKELPEGKWFCCTDCKRIYCSLQNLLICEAEKLPDTLLDIVKKKDKGLGTVTALDVRWRLLSGKISTPETKLFLSEAVAIFHDCFDPIVDSTTGRDFIPSMVYGRNIRAQDFGGMYCTILTVNSSVASVGILRVFGRDIAELPLVATSKGSQGKGYFQLLFSCIMKLLAFLKVRRLVLPAADVAESIWTDKFGFKKIIPEQLSDYKKFLLTFQGTSMLEKLVPECRVIHREAAFEVSGDLLV